MIKHFVITANMSNGDAWETKRHTKKGMETVVQDILSDMTEVTDPEDNPIVGFTVVEVGV